MTEYLRFVLGDGSEVLFESEETDLVAPHGGRPRIIDAGPLAARMESIARAAHQVAHSLRSAGTPDEVALTFGVKMSTELNAWFLAKAQTEGALGVTLTWRRPDGETSDA